VAELNRKSKRRDEQEERQIKWMREELERTREQLHKAETEKERVTVECKEEMRTLWEEQKSVLGGLRSSTSVGQVGESLVSHIFANLQLGSWEDTRGQTGAGDGQWTWSGNGGGPLKCLVEVKRVASLHTQKDVARFWSNVDANMRASKINAALFISLSARIDDTRPLDVRLYNGVPVMQASRRAEDVLPASVMIELAFHAFASLWPTIARSRGDDTDGMLDAVARHFEAQVEELTKLSKRIDNVERLAVTLQREAVGMRKIRDNLCTGVDQTRLQYPQLALPEAPPVAEPGDAWTSATGKALLDAITTFKTARKGRYPKSLAELEIPEETLTFASSIPNCFEKAVSIVKSQQTRAKRPREE
jgi:hypothetical protein